MQVLFALTLLAAVALGVLCGLAPVLRDANGLVVVLEAVALLVVFRWAQGWLLRRMAYVRWIRPRFPREVSPS